jgi:hypothetical protein
LAHLRQPEAVLLPAAVVTLVSQKTDSNPPRRAAWHNRSIPQCLRRAASVLLTGYWPSTTRSRIAAAATLSAAVIAAAMVVFRFWPSAETVPGPAQQSFNMPNPLAAETPLGDQPGAADFSGFIDGPSASAWDNDDLALQISQLQSQITELENRLSALKGLESSAPAGGQQTSSGNSPIRSPGTEAPQQTKSDHPNPVPSTPVPPTQESKP